MAAFTINIEDSGETPLDPITIADTMPRGMEYISDDRQPNGTVYGQQVIWPNVGPLGIGNSTSIHITTRISESEDGRLVNRVDITANPVPEDRKDKHWRPICIFFLRVPNIKQNRIEIRTILGDDLGG